VAIFATFGCLRTASWLKTLPNQGLERKIARNLSSSSLEMQHDMTTHLTGESTLAIAKLAKLAALTAMASALVSAPGWAQNSPNVTAAQKETAKAVAQKGVPLNELAANAPDRYTVKQGDTLWSISRLYLKSPWRWPELWGMNMDEIKNPHRIYPGQVLILERKNGLASLRLEGTEQTESTEPPTVKVAPRTRYEMLSDLALPTLRSNIIEAFLAEPTVVDEAGLSSAPRIVSALESRVLITRGDRVYARGPDGKPLLDDQNKEQLFRVFRNATPLKDPGTGEVLGYEAQYVGKAVLVRSESSAEADSGSRGTVPVPATIDIIGAKEEMRVGDRLLPEPPRQLQTYTPHAPNEKVEGRIVSVYGNAVVNAGQNQVVAISKGTEDGMEPGIVLAILKDGARILDRSGDTPTQLKLPNERNGLLMVFRTFERVSYALILEITDGVRVGDRLVNPRPDIQ
jgi:nucleoid-associated protein YgaU